MYCGRLLTSPLPVAAHRSTSSNATSSSQRHRYSRGLPRPEFRGLRHSLVNVHPQPGEARAYLATPSAPLTEDYALIGFVPGIAPEHSILILAGTTTFGTQAAAEYVSRENSVGELLTRLSGSNTGELKPFEAVVRVKMARGVPVESELVALRRR